MARMWRTLGRVAAALLSTLVVVIGWPAVPALAAGQVTSIANASITETNAAATLSFNVTYTGGTAAETVHWATANGTATAPADYIASSGTASLPAAGCQCATVSVPIVGDLLDESNETFTVTLSSPSVGALGTATATGTINDNDPTPVVAINSVGQNEGNSGIANQAFTISLSTASGRTSSVSYFTQSGTATSGSDFTSTSGSVTFAAGETTKTVNVPVVGDVAVETNETYTVRLFGASNLSYAASRNGTGTIVNDDAGPVVSVNNVIKVEGNSGTANAAFAVSLSRSSAQTITVKYATADGTATAGSDYTTTSGTLTFTANQTSKTVNVPVKGDTTSEADETFSLILNTPVNATVGSAGTGTITNDDAVPSLSITDVTTAEGNGGSTTASFTVTLGTASGQTVSVDWTTTAGTASAGADYVAATGTVSFPPGQTSKTVGVSVLGDTIDEVNETYTVDLTNPVDVTIADNQGLGTITDDDPAPSIGVTDASVLEGNAGTANADFTLSLSSASGKTVSVSWTTTDGTATAGPDYTAGGGTLTFTPGQTSKVVSVSVIGDVLNEGDETFSVDLSAPVNASIADSLGAGTITDDDPQPGISVDDVSTIEGNAGSTNAVFTVSLDRASGRTVTVDWTTTSASASPGADYTTAGGSLTFTPGQTSKTVSVAVKGDALDEFDETFTVDLTNPLHATIQDGQGVGTITDDDAPAALSVSDLSQAEGDAGTSLATFTVSLDAPSGKTVSVDWTTNDATARAGSDYAGASGTLTFTPGQTTKSVSVSVSGDVTFEADETFTVDLSNVANATVADGQGTGTVLNDDAAPTLAVGDLTLSEGDAGTTTATFTVSKTGATALPASVDWATSDATALAGSDYTGGSGSLTFTSGQTTATVTVTVSGDLTYEPTEAFHVDLSNPSGATIADGLGVGTITNDDPPPSVSISDATVFEGDGGPKGTDFGVTLSNPSYQTITVDWATGDDTALDGVDYAGASGTVTFAPGQTAKTVTVNDIGDTLDENDETFAVGLSNVASASIADASGTGTIVDDDGPVSISVNDVAVGESDLGTTPLAFTVSLDYPSGKPVSVDWTASGTSATAGSDFTAASGTVNFPPDEMVKTVTLNVNGDAVFETDEVLAVDLSNAVNATVNDGHGVGTITNDDAQPTLSIDDVTLDEGNAGTASATFHVTLTGATEVAASVDWATAPGTATAGSDFSAGGATLNFPPGDTSATIDVPIQGDTTFEPDETLVVNLTGAAGATLTDTQGVGTIRNDDKQVTGVKAAVAKTKKGLLAKGTLTGGAFGGMRVTVAIFKQKGKRYVKAGARTVALKKVKDGTGSYLAKFKRPKAGRYKLVVTYAGDATHLACTAAKRFSI